MKVQLAIVMFCIGSSAIGQTLSDFGIDSTELDTSLQMTFWEVRDTVFGQLPEEKITTGILIDRSPRFVDISKVDGGNPDHIINRDTVYNLYGMLHLGHADTSEWPNVFTIDSLASAIRETTGNLPLMLISKEYNLIRSDVFTNNLMELDGNTLIDKSGNGTPFEEKLAFAVSPLSLSVESSNVSLVLTDAFFISDIEFDDMWLEVEGIPEMIPVTLNQPISFVLPQESNVLRFTAVLGTDTVSSRSAMKVNPPEILGQEPTIVCTIPGTKHEYGIWEGCESDISSCSDCVRKVMLIVEGYDSFEGREAPAFDMTAFSLDDIYDIANEGNQIDNLRAKGYDIVIINFDDWVETSLEELKDATQLLIRLLRDKLDVCGSDHEMVVMGVSAGGLLARYALAEMEQNAENHNTRLLLTFDTPHLGANIPLSIQHYIRFLKNTVPINFFFAFKPLKLLKDMWKSTPVRQMSVYHSKFTQGGQNDANPAPDFYTFYAVLQGLNGGVGWPVKCRNVAIAEGSGNGTGQGFNPGTKLFAANVSAVLTNVIGDGWAVHNNTNSKVFRAVAFTYIPWTNIWFPTNYTNVKIDNSRPFDNAPGGGGFFLDAIDIPFHSRKVTQDESFVPTISALDLRNTTNLFYNVHSNITGNDVEAFRIIDYTSSVTPVDAIYVETNNKVHVAGANSISAGMIAFFENEIMPTDHFLQNRTIVAPRDFEAFNEMQMGRNVTARYPQGDFVVQNTTSTTDFRASTRIIGKPGTHIKPTGSGRAHAFIAPFDIDCLPSNKWSGSDDDETDDDETILPPTGERSVLEEKLPISDKVKIYPNPTSGEFQLTVGRGQETQVYIYDIFGRLIKQLTIVNRKSEIVNISKHPKGIYLVKVIQGEEIFIRKLLHQ